MSKTALVTGGAGFIGSHLCGRLLEEGYKVICIDNLITGKKSNLKNILGNPNFEFIKHDVIKPPPKNFKFQISNFKFIFHLASPASPNKNSPKSYLNHPLETLLANSLGTYNLLELAKKGNSRFIFASSSEVYGDPKISPQNEKYFGNVNPTGIRSVYDEGKRFGEALCMVYFRRFGVDIRIARIFNTYGIRQQRDDGRVVPNFITQAVAGSPITVYGDGTQTRSFCYIDDMVDGLLLIAKSGSAGGEVVNLGNPVEYRIIEVARMVKNLSRSTSEIIFEELPEDDPTQRKPDIEKAKRLLGWYPKIDLVEGLKKTIEYFRAR